MKNKILIIISSLKLGGGAERVASTIGTELNKKHEVHYLTFYKHENNYPFEGKHHCLNEIFREDIISKGLKLITRAREIASYCKKNKIDTCIAFMEAANFPAILSKTLFRNKSKIIVSERNNPLKQDKVSQKLIKIMYPKADLIVCVSKGVEYQLNKYFNLKKTKTIYNPINKSFFNNNIIDKKDEIYFKNKEAFISVGRLEKQKAFDILIKAFSKLNKKNSILLIIGEGSLRNKLQKQINSLNMNEKIFLLGRKKNIYAYLKKSNYFIMSSLYEGLPNSLLEAVSSNLICISTDCKTGPKEILEPKLSLNKTINYPHLGEFGILVETNNVNSLLEGMKLLEKKDILKKYSKDLNRAKDFEVDKIVKEWGNIL